MTPEMVSGLGLARCEPASPRFGSGLWGEPQSDPGFEAAPFCPLLSSGRFDGGPRQAELRGDPPEHLERVGEFFALFGRGGGRGEFVALLLQLRQQCWKALRLVEQAGGGLTSGGCLDAGSLQRLGSRVRRGPRLGDERRAERELACDQVLVAPLESLDLALVGRGQRGGVLCRARFLRVRLRSIWHLRYLSKCPYDQDHGLEGTPMRTVPVSVVDPAEMAGGERDELNRVVGEIEESGTIELDALPAAVRAQLLFALDACAKGQVVATVAEGKPLTSTEAARLLGMSRTHLVRLCDEGRIESYKVGNALRISSDEVMRILTARGQAKTEAREAAATADQRRRARAARAAGLT